MMCAKGLMAAMVVADFVRRCLPPLKKRNRVAWTYTGVNDIGRTNVGPNNVLSNAAMLKVVKKILVEECGSLVPLEGATPLAEDPNRSEILRRLPLCDLKGVCQGSSGTIQIGQLTRTTGPWGRSRIAEGKNAQQGPPSAPRCHARRGPEGGLPESMVPTNAAMAAQFFHQPLLGFPFPP